MESDVILLGPLASFLIQNSFPNNFFEFYSYKIVSSSDIREKEA